MGLGDQFTDAEIETITTRPVAYPKPVVDVTYECICGYTAGTMAALQKHIAKFPDSDFNEQGDRLDGLRARYGRIHKPVASTWAATKEEELRGLDRSYGEQLFRVASSRQLEEAIHRVIDEFGALSAQGLQVRVSRDFGVLDLDRTALPSSTFLTFLQDRPELCCAMYSQEGGGWMVGQTEDHIHHHVEEQMRAEMIRKAKAQRAQAKIDAIEAAERQAVAGRSEAFMAPFFDGSLTPMAAYSSGSSWSEAMGGDDWRDHAKVLLQLYEEGHFVFKVRHWSEDPSGSQSYEHENSWYSGNFGRIGSGSILRLSVVGIATNVDSLSGQAEAVQATSTVFEAIAAYSVSGDELLRLQGQIPSAIARRKGLDELKFNPTPPNFL